MQKSLDSIMSNSLKAAFGKAKASSETKTSAGTEASTGATNPFSNLLERVMQKNQPKMKATESNPSSKMERKASKEPQTKESTATEKPENNQEIAQTNQPETESTKAENLSEKSQATQTTEQPSELDTTPASDTEQTLETAELDSPSVDNTLTEESPETDPPESAPITPELNTNMNLLISLQQPMTLGLYQSVPINTADANNTEAISSIESNPSENNTQSVLASSTLPALPILAPLTGASAAFALPLQKLEPLPASTPQTTDLSPNLPIADTLPLSQSSEASSQGLADILDNGQTALPGTVFGSTEMTMQASSSAGTIDMSQTITLSNGPIPLEVLSGQLEIPTTTEILQNATSETPLLQQAEFSLGLPSETGLEKPTQNSTTSANNLPPLEATFASLLEPTEALSQFGSDIEIETLPSEGPVEFETLSTEIPAADTGAFPDLTQATATQNMNSSSKASSATDNPIAQFTSSAQTPAEQVAEGTIYSIKQGQRELIIRLNPDNLGEVRINLLHHGDNSLSARLIASTPESHDLLKSQLDSLKQNLESQGIQVERLNVIMAGSVDTQNQSSQSQHHTGQQQPDTNTNNPQQQSTNQGQQPDSQTFAQMAGQYSQQKHGASPNHHNAFQTHNNTTTDVPTDGATKPENQARHHANGNISILV